MKSFKQYLIEKIEPDWKLRNTDLSERQKSEHNVHGKRLSDEHVRELEIYKSNSRHLNDDLRNSENHTESGTIKHPYSRAIRRMDHVTSHVLKNNYNVYRGFGDHSEHIKDLKPGDTFTDHGYTGTTTNEHIGMQWSFLHYDPQGSYHHVAKIHVPKGTKGHYLDMHENDYNNENELTLHRGTKFQVIKHSHELRQDPYDSSNESKIPFLITHLKVIGQEPKPVEQYTGGIHDEHD